jgi:hypothetical protein
LQASAIDEVLEAHRAEPDSEPFSQYLEVLRGPSRHVMWRPIQRLELSSVIPIPIGYREKESPARPQTSERRFDDVARIAKVLKGV